MERRPRCDDRPREYANVTTTENGGKKVENAAPSILSSFLSALHREGRRRGRVSVLGMKYPLSVCQWCESLFELLSSRSITLAIAWRATTHLTRHCTPPVLTPK